MDGYQNIPVRLWQGAGKPFFKDPEWLMFMVKVRIDIKTDVPVMWWNGRQRPGCHHEKRKYSYLYYVSTHSLSCSREVRTRSGESSLQRPLPCLYSHNRSTPHNMAVLIP